MTFPHCTVCDDRKRVDDEPCPACALNGRRAERAAIQARWSVYDAGGKPITRRAMAEATDVTQGEPSCPVGLATDEPRKRDEGTVTRTSAGRYTVTLPPRWPR